VDVVVVLVDVLVDTDMLPPVPVEVAVALEVPPPVPPSLVPQLASSAKRSPVFVARKRRFIMSRAVLFAFSPRGDYHPRPTTICEGSSQEKADGPDFRRQERRS
jgi:hypothetical protein